MVRLAGGHVQWPQGGGRGATAFFVEQDRVLFTGDVVMNNSFLAASGVSSMRAWIAAFDTLEALGTETIVPAHGGVGDDSLVADNRALMRDVQARARAHKAQGRSADETAAAVQEEFRERHPDWPRANGLAVAARSAWQEAP